MTSFDSIEQEARLTAYALGELSPEEAAVVAAEISTSPEKQAFVAEMQELGALLASELQEESALSLTAAQHHALEESIQGRVNAQALELIEEAIPDAPASSKQSAIGEPDDDDLPRTGGLFRSPWIALSAKMAAGGSLIAFLLIVGSIFQLEGLSPSKKAKEPTKMYAPRKPHVGYRRFANLPVLRSPMRRQNRAYRPMSPPVSSLHTPRSQTTPAPAPSPAPSIPVAPAPSTPALLPSTAKPKFLEASKRADKTRLALGQNVVKSDDGKRGKKGKSTGEKKPQVWKRTRQNTVLSRVSVGGNKYLLLKKMRVTVSVEGVRARTVIDHIYYNPHGRTLQGTFKYTLPARASVSYYAMFVGRQRRVVPRFFNGKLSRREMFRLTPAALVKKAPKRDWGRLREARLVPAEKGRQVYEQIVRRRIDPALLEQDAPNTFKGRVFPIPANGYNRVIIAYEQTLPRLGKELVYRFRFPQQVADSIDMSIEYDKKHATLQRSNLRKLRCRQPHSLSFLRCYWEQRKPDRDAVLYFRPKRGDMAWTAGADPTDNKKYLYLQAKLALPSAKGGYGASQGVFLLDTSLSANPDLFAAHVKLLEQVLVRNQRSLKRFNVVFFDTGAVWAKRTGWIENTAANRRRLLHRLSKVVLEGATNFGVALRALARPPWSIKQGTPLDVFVLSDGQLNWGNTQLNAALSRFRKTQRYGTLRFFAYQMGIGSENAAFGAALAQQGGAVFPCLSRSVLARCATAHTRPAMLVESVKLNGIGASEVLVEGRQVSLFPGALFRLAARYTRDGRATLVVKGTYMGKSLILNKSFRVSEGGDLAPRAWGEMAVAQLTALKAPSLTKLIVAYAQHFRIPNEHVSMLVLETDKEYKQYGLDALKTAKRVVDLRLFLETFIKRFGLVRSPRVLWRSLLRRGAKRAGILRNSAWRAIASILRKVPSSDFVFRGRSTAMLYTKSEVKDPRYLNTRLLHANQFGPFVREAKRRVRKDVPGAVRALSSIVELHPGNPQALRLVGYYLNAWQQPEAAAPLFLRVLKRRSFEPQSYRDLARSLLKMKRYGLAAALYEILLASRWHSRFGRIHTVTKEEYALLLQEAIRYGKMRPSIRSLLRRRRALLGLRVKRARIRVTVTWNTDNTDIDLWVTEPDGERCSYRKKRTYSGGVLLDDLTRGYGPERYEHKRGIVGRYDVKLHYFSHNTNVLGNETHASVQIVLDAGTHKQRIIEKNVVLRYRGQRVNVISVTLK